jgi:hypothetical protein
MFPWNMFPFNKDMRDTLQKMKPEEIDKYVQDIMGKVLPANMNGMMNPMEMLKGANATGFQQPASVDSLNSTAYETHDYVFVRIPMRNDDWVKKLSLYHTSNQLIVANIPNSEDQHTITLPAIVKKKGASANYKDGVLEVKIPKNIDMQYSQIDVSEIL